MQALRLQFAGTITSFRHPLFPHGQQISYPCPPPATLYGLVCSALGERVAPSAFRLAYRFTYEDTVDDLEHVFLIGAPSNPVKLSPFTRQLLTQPRLTLYLDRPEWLTVFKSPRYVLTLGRSQDLITLQAAQVVTLEQASSAYLRDTIVPMPANLERYTVWQMPRSLTTERFVTWQAYAHVTLSQVINQPMWVDRDQPTWRGHAQGVMWLTLA
jgi:CRISPR-associated protein Cas5t